MRDVISNTHGATDYQIRNCNFFTSGQPFYNQNDTQLQVKLGSHELQLPAYCCGNYMVNDEWLEQAIVWELKLWKHIGIYVNHCLALGPPEYYLQRNDIR